MEQEGKLIYFPRGGVGRWGWLGKVREGKVNVRSGEVTGSREGRRKEGMEGKESDKNDVGRIGGEQEEN